MITSKKILQSRQEWEAEVRSISKTGGDGLITAQVYAYGLFDGVPDSKLPWATYKLPVGFGANRGDFTPAQVGDIVWVDFPYRTHGEIDTRRPRITGSVHFAPEGSLNFPDESHKRDYQVDSVQTYNDITIERIVGGTYRVTDKISDSVIEMEPGGLTTVRASKKILLEADGSTLEMDASGIKLNGKRIDFNK